MIEEFHSIDELYERVLPALTTRMGELHKQGLNLITSDDIWNYLILNKWKLSQELTLFDVTSDILNVDGSKVIDYINKS